MKKNKNRKERSFEVWLKVYVQVKGLDNQKGTNLFGKYGFLIFDIIKLMIEVAIKLLLG